MWQEGTGWGSGSVIDVSGYRARWADSTAAGICVFRMQDNKYISGIKHSSEQDNSAW